MDKNHLYNPLSSFPGRFNAFIYISNIFQDSSGWYDHLNELDELSKKTGKNYMVKPVAQIMSILLGAMAALFAFSFVCTPW